MKQNELYLNEAIILKFLLPLQILSKNLQKNNIHQHPPLPIFSFREDDRNGNRETSLLNARGSLLFLFHQSQSQRERDRDSGRQREEMERYT